MTTEERERERERDGQTGALGVRPPADKPGAPRPEAEAGVGGSTPSRVPRPRRPLGQRRLRKFVRGHDIAGTGPLRAQQGLRAPGDPGHPYGFGQRCSAGPVADSEKTRALRATARAAEEVPVQSGRESARGHDLWALSPRALQLLEPDTLPGCTVEGPQATGATSAPDPLLAQHSCPQPLGSRPCREPGILPSGSRRHPQGGTMRGPGKCWIPARGNTSPE